MPQRCITHYWAIEISSGMQKQLRIHKSRQSYHNRNTPHNICYAEQFGNTNMQTRSRCRKYRHWRHFLVDIEPRLPTKLLRQAELPRGSKQHRTHWRSLSGKNGSGQCIYRRSNNPKRPAMQPHARIIWHVLS